MDSKNEQNENEQNEQENKKKYDLQQLIDSIPIPQEEEEEQEEEQQENEESEGYESDESNDDVQDDDTYNEEDEYHMTRAVLQQLITLNKMQRQNNKLKEKSFVPSIKSFLRLDLMKKIKKIKETPFLVKNLLKLSSYIVNGKIRLDNINKSDMAMFEHICQSDTPKIDKKAILAEDHRIHMVLRQAIREIEKEGKLTNGK